jgi:DNA polymerase-3 subunit beta
MKVQVTQSNLAKALNNVARVSTSRAGLPILNNVLLRTESNRLIIATTNLEIASVQRVNAKVTAQGSVTVPAKIISEFVSNLPKENITIEVKGRIVHISSGKHKSTINGMGDEEFPELPAIDEQQQLLYELRVDDFKIAANQTVITASNDSTRPVLTGVYWHTFDGNLYFAATDGYRLAEKRIVQVKTEIAAIIPTATIQEVVRILDETEDVMRVSFDETQVKFQVGDNEIISRLIDGNFPDYRQLIPEETVTSCILKVDELKRIVKLSGLFARESGGSVQLEADPDTDILTIHSIASELGQNTSEVITSINGERNVITLNSRYLNDALNVLASNNISIGFSGSLSPCLIQPDEKNNDYKHIIMPIKS